MIISQPATTAPPDPIKNPIECRTGPCTAPMSPTTSQAPHRSPCSHSTRHKKHCQHQQHSTSAYWADVLGAMRATPRQQPGAGALRLHPSFQCPHEVVRHPQCMTTLLDPLHTLYMAHCTRMPPVLAMSQVERRPQYPAPCPL